MGMGLPSAITGLFQGLLLFYLLAADLFITFRLKRVGVVESPAAKPAAPVENAA
jgi:general nucleoside transport system permease protein